MKKLISCPLLLLLLTACAGNVPLNIRQPPVNNPGIREAGTNLNQYLGQKVRWGGTISAIENKVTDTWIEIVGRELGSYGRPYANDESLGRFLVRIDGYLDPVIYEVNREITIYGVVESTITRKIDEYPYIYPLVKAEEYYLWPEYTYRDIGYTGYDPYYYPYPFRYYSRFGFGYGYRDLYDYRLGRRHYYY